MELVAEITPRARQFMGSSDTLENELSDDGSSTYDLLTVAASMFIIFGGMIPFYCQHQEILRTKNFRGFSLFVCLNLIISNCLRIMFW
ncbi:unnamed protein product [Soboliphyme baturini]|uniref:Uncharacterized protein n=1 Tax=Soboliphyme baturini TaxID=241478 RepID=A0A183I9R6_9BILA|nr:unnamed protein product [Soboliphyme baturini]